MNGSVNKTPDQPDPVPDQPTNSTKRRTTALRLVIAGVAVIVVGGVILALTGVFGGSTLLAAAPDAPGTSAAPLPTPTSGPIPETPSVWPTPSPGGTSDIERPQNLVLPFDETAEIDGGLSARIDRVEPVKGEARGPGEIAGEALRVTLSLGNTGNAAVSLLGSAVNVYFGAEQTPAVELSGPDRLAMPESLAVGATATARLVFAVPYSQQDKVSITLDLLSTTPIVVFEGAVPQD